MSFFPRWLKTALEEVGVAEIPGAGNNPKIVQYHSATTLKATQDDVPWCASFVNWVLAKNGVTGDGSAMAKDFLRWGEECTPRLGCIVVMSRTGNPANGHVGFMLDKRGGLVTIVSGNVSDRVCVSGFAESRILGYRWPKGEPNA